MVALTLQQRLSQLASFISRLSNGGEGWFDHQQDRMTVARAATHPAVIYCVKRVAGAFQIMPINLYRKTDRKIEKQTQHNNYQLLRWQPNSYQTPSQWKWQMMCHYLLWGNARSYIVRDAVGRPQELIPLPPDRTITRMVEGQKYHATLIDRDDNLSLYADMEQNTEKVVFMRNNDVWHLPGFNFNGVEGMSIVSLARETLGIGMDGQKMVSKQQKKGYSGGLKVQIPQGMLRDKGDAEEFYKDLKKKVGGINSEEAILMLREGITADVLAMSNTDAQFIETMRLNREDVALLFCFEGILGDSDNSSYASEEQKNISFRTNVLGPISTAIEEESDLKLLTARERTQDFYHKVSDGALFRTEKSQTAAYISQLITARVLSPNEGREMLDLNPYEGGDEYTNPAIDKKVDNGGGGASQQPNENRTARQIAVAHIGHLIGVEANRVKAGAVKSSNFLSWMDNFYDQNWESSLADNLETVGIDREESSKHCTESKRRLLDVCDMSTPDNLAENVAKCVSSWKSRANLIGVAENV